MNNVLFKLHKTGSIIHKRLKFQKIKIRFGDIETES